MKKERQGIKEITAFFFIFYSLNTCCTNLIGILVNLQMQSVAFLSEMQMKSEECSANNETYNTS